MILSSISSNEACIRVNSLKKKKKGLFISIINDGVARTTNNGPGNNYTRVFVKSVVFVDERDFVHQGRCEFVSSLYFYRFV